MVNSAIPGKANSFLFEIRVSLLMPRLKKKKKVIIVIIIIIIMELLYIVGKHVN